MQMFNYARGEIPAKISGKERKMFLTLGGLSRLESVISSSSIIKFIKDLEKGEASLSDVLKVVLAALADDPDINNVEDIELEGGAVEAYRLVGELLRRTFVGDEKSS